MSLTTYAELKAGIVSWAKRSDLGPYLDDITTLAEKKIMREVRATEMETSFSDSISGSGTVSAPSGFLGWKAVYLNTSPITIIVPQPIGQLLQQYPKRTSDTVPHRIAYAAGTFHFGPFPDSTYAIAGTYYARQGPLASSLHALFTNNPDLYLFASLAELEPFMKNDSRVALWTAKYESIKAAINKEADAIGGAASGMMVTVEK